MPKPKDFKYLPRLLGSQAQASRPDGQVWLSASAGAGKTQVLTARVLRLLLNDANPESILCLTFTKAGAAEMADRIHERLGAWVTLPEADLTKELFALGEPHMDNRQADARQLFAKVLDARGGGLRIQTIHSFAQTVLAAFPAEAGLTVGFRPVEGREEMQLKRQALSTLVATAEKEGRLGTIDRLQLLARQIGEDATRKLLDRCAQAPEAMEDLGSGVGPLVRRWLGLGEGDVEALIAHGCSDEGFDHQALLSVRAMCLQSGGSRLAGFAEKITSWLGFDGPRRIAQLPLLLGAWAKDDGDLRRTAGWHPKDLSYFEVVEPLHAHFSQMREMHRALVVSKKIIAALELGQEYARVYGDAKRAAGVVDFNDMIRATLKLLKKPEIGDWIRFKLDQSIDHILVDEAQDTNSDQWDIVKALTEEFFAGDGAKPDKVRTVFAVGDFKQAIFSFQGTNPEEFGNAGTHFRDSVEAIGLDFETPAIDQSFRSSQPILDVVDKVMAEVGEAALGLPEPLRAHVAHEKACEHSGFVQLMPPFTATPDDPEAEESDGGDEEGWMAPAELRWAAALAKQVKHWTSGGIFLDKEGRNAEPGDVMILLRSRSELARLIVSRLYEEKVPVAGVDRLRLDAPIAVQDLMACIRFVLQPEDDLSLAALLVSPLIGWSQEELFARAHGRQVGLWQHLRATQPEEALFVLRELLSMADRTTPYDFLEAILSGPIGGRGKMLARLGEEARDPIEELLNATLQFEGTNTPSLELFLDWFCRGEVDIKRDASKRVNAVRVMTVHGSKGLQAPIVVLADATADPSKKPKSGLDWVADDDFATLPLFRPKKDELFGSLAASAKAQDEREDQEHWRLLYVAMTRAEEHLYVGGALKPSQQEKGPSEKSWHHKVAAGMLRLDETAHSEDGTLTLHRKGKRSKDSGKDDESERWADPIPDWATLPAPEEARPPRPLAPSTLGVEDAASSPPPDPVMRAAAERGRILHALFERLPAVRPEDRVAAARRWLSAQLVDDAEALITSALAVIEHPDLASVFAQDALAEAPLAGVVEGQVIAGTVDRLIVTDAQVTVVDYKTGRRVPGDEAGVPTYHKAQMAAYAAVLEGIFPGRTVQAALLYTSGPKLITLSAETLAAWRPGHIAP